METVLEVVRAKISGYIKSYATLKIGLHTDLGNSRTEKASFKQELVELRSQLETERADRKQNSAPVARLFKKLTLRLIIILSPLRAREKN
jgi:hypothetical protein